MLEIDSSFLGGSLLGCWLLGALSGSFLGASLGSSLLLWGGLGWSSGLSGSSGGSWLLDGLSGTLLGGGLLDFLWSSWLLGGSLCDFLWSSGSCSCYTKKVKIMNAMNNIDQNREVHFSHMYSHPNSLQLYKKYCTDICELWRNLIGIVWNVNSQSWY